MNLAEHPMETRFAERAISTLSFVQLWSEKNHALRPTCTPEDYQVSPYHELPCQCTSTPRATPISSLSRGLMGPGTEDCRGRPLAGSIGVSVGIESIDGEDEGERRVRSAHVDVQTRTEYSPVSRPRELSANVS